MRRQELSGNVTDAFGTAKASGGVGVVRRRKRNVEAERSLGRMCAQELRAELLKRSVDWPSSKYTPSGP